MRTRLIRSLPVAAALVASLAAPAAATVIIGTSGPDVLVGTTRADTIRARGGADTLYGKAGADWLYAGRDRQRDVVHAGAGNDHIYATLGDVVWAGRGNDTIVWQRWPRIGFVLLRVNCGPGYDRIVGEVNPWLLGYPRPGRPDTCERIG